MRWLSAHSNQLRLGGAGVEVRDEELVGRSTLCRMRWWLSACEMLILTPEWCTWCDSSLNCRTANEFRAGRSQMPVSAQYANSLIHVLA